LVRFLIGSSIEIVNRFRIGIPNQIVIGLIPIRCDCLLNRSKNVNSWAENAICLQMRYVSGCQNHFLTRLIQTWTRTT
jgi:hypothetical protein